MVSTVDLNVVISEKTINILGIITGTALFLIGCSMVAKSIK